MVPSSLEPFALAATHEGAWYGADPTGYKFVRREVVRAQWAPALDSLLRKQTRGDIHGLKTRSHDQRGGAVHQALRLRRTANGYGA